MAAHPCRCTGGKKSTLFRKIRWTFRPLSVQIHEDVVSALDRRALIRGLHSARQRHPASIADRVPKSGEVGGVGARQRLIDLIRAHGAAQRLFAVCAVVANGALHSCVSWPTYRRLWFAYLCSARTPVMRTPFAYAATLFRHSLWRVSAALDSPRQDLPLLDRIAATPGFRAASPCVRRQSKLAK